MQLGTVLTRHARYWPDRNAVICGDQVLTYRMFNARVNQLANALLRAGIRRGDKVACVLPNCIEILDLYWAAAKIGAVVVPLSPLLTNHGLVSLIWHADASMALVGPDHAPASQSPRVDFPIVPSTRFVIVGGVVEGYVTFEDLIRGLPIPSRMLLTERNAIPS